MTAYSICTEAELANFGGEARALRLEEQGFVERTVNVGSAGLYQMSREYFPTASLGIAIERSLSINGATQRRVPKQTETHYLSGFVERL